MNTDEPDKVRQRRAAIEATSLDDAELSRIRESYETHLARGNYVHPMTHDVGRLLAEVDRLRIDTKPPRPPYIGARTFEPGPYEAMLADTGTPRWGAVVIGAGRLYADLTGRALPAPDADASFEDAARDRLGRLGAAIAIELLNHGIDTDDERPLEAAAAELGEFGDIPAAAAAAIGPPAADLLAAAVGIIETARAAERAEREAAGQ